MVFAIEFQNFLHGSQYDTSFSVLLKLEVLQSGCVKDLRSLSSRSQNTILEVAGTMTSKDRSLESSYDLKHDNVLCSKGTSKSWNR